ncbi:hypothetical protein G6514_001399 [Epicoccum nigrum]|nr:hypothetical protein G6514_001399 [Epicoccum nigrum]
MGVLSGLTIAVAGTLDYDNTQIKKWVEANGGRYSPNVSKYVTHLIASKEAWKSASDDVQKAVKHEAWVLTYDWLEDSLLNKRKLAETKYSWEDKEQERKRNKEMKKLGLLADTKKFQDGCEAAKKATGTGTSKSRSRAVTRKPRQSRSVLVGDMVNVPFVSAAESLKQKREAREAAAARTAAEQAAKKASQPPTDASSSPPASASASSHTLTAPSSQPEPQPAPQAKKSLKDLYHYFLDATGFEYKILLTRCDLPANTMQRYHLSILESHTKPNVYCTFIQYYPAGPAESNTNSSGCIQAVFDFNNTFRSTTIKAEAASDADDDDDDDSNNNNNDNNEEQTQETPAKPPTQPQQQQQQKQQQHPEATRLLSLSQPPGPSPSPSLPYKTLLTPLRSPFPLAFRSFRHAFRDLTLLGWEERFADGSPLARRARRLNVEPFVYVRPKQGMPTGLAPQVLGGMGMFCGTPEAALGADADVHGAGDAVDDGYVRPAFAFLPALDAPLGDGVVGSRVRAERGGRERKVEEKRREEEGERRCVKREGSAGLERAKRSRYSGPLFDWWRTGRDEEGGGGGGGGKKRRLFPAERRGWDLD